MKGRSQCDVIKVWKRTCEIVYRIDPILAIRKNNFRRIKVIKVYFPTKMAWNWNITDGNLGNSQVCENQTVHTYITNGSKKKSP